MNISMKLFISLIVPILTYGSEIWAPYIFQDLNETNSSTVCDKTPAESLHIKCCKLILGVNRTSTNAAVRGELGSFPLALDMIIHSIDYWLLINRDQHKLMTADTSTLRSRALYESKILSDAACKTWITGIQKVLIHINLSNIWDDHINASRSTIAKDLRSALQAKYENIWLAHIHSPRDSNKMRTFANSK